MTETPRYEIEFHLLEQGVEFRYAFDGRRAYDDAKALLDDLLGPRGALPEHRSRPGWRSSDSYCVDEAQYRAFDTFMRGRRA